MSILPTEIIRLYRIWTSILYRCENPQNKQYPNYGGRGITICDEWKDFNKFVEDVGKGSKPELHLDREDNDKGYFKENCRWVTPKVNHRNKRNNKTYNTHIGTICQSEFIETIGFTRKQFKRAVEKYGEEEIILMFKEDRLPQKRIVPDLLDIVGQKIGKFQVLELDSNKATGARYFCLCDCGNKTRITRFKLLKKMPKYCKSCTRRGDRNPNSKVRRSI
jgi:hypothetical protein